MVYVCVLCLNVCVLFCFSFKKVSVCYVGDSLCDVVCVALLCGGLKCGCACMICYTCLFAFIVRFVCVVCALLCDVVCVFCVLCCGCVLLLFVYVFVRCVSSCVSRMVCVLCFCWLMCVCACMCLCVLCANSCVLLSRFSGCSFCVVKVGVFVCDVV